MKVMVEIGKPNGVLWALPSVRGLWRLGSGSQVAFFVAVVIVLYVSASIAATIDVGGDGTFMRLTCIVYNTMMINVRVPLCQTPAGCAYTYSCVCVSLANEWMSAHHRADLCLV